MDEALVIIQDNDLLFYRTGHALEHFPGLRPPLYNKTKTLRLRGASAFALRRRQPRGPPFSLPVLEVLRQVRHWGAAQDDVSLPSTHAA